MALFSSLRGRKTYVVGFMMILLAILKGDEIDIQMLLEGLGLMTIRAGVAKLEPAKSDAPPAGPGPAVLAASLFLGCALLMQTGCSSVAPGNDPVVVNAERTTEVAMETFDTFLQWEHTHRETLAAVPEIRRSADFIRLKAPDWLMTARSMTRAYKSSRTPEDKLNLDTALAVLRAGITEAQRYLGHQ